MPISALTPVQQQLLAFTINNYVNDQLSKGSLLVYNQIRTATSAQIQAALLPSLNKQLSDAQATAASLPAAQAVQTTAVNQLVIDIQAIIANLT